MSDLYLILHKVRGQPAFDVAHKLVCVKCQSYESVTGQWCEAKVPQDECDHCNGEGYSWQIPTSGHTAYPYFSQRLNEIVQEDVMHVKALPEGLPDHFQPQVAPTSRGSTGRRAIAFLQRLGALPIEEVRRA